MKLYNNTDFSKDELFDIQQTELLLVVQNNWRQRMIRLYAHPTDKERVISIGKTFETLPEQNQQTVICDELRSDWSREFATGKKFVTTD